MTKAGVICPMLRENGCGDITENCKTTAGICTDNCPIAHLPICILDLKPEYGNRYHDVQVAILLYSGKTVKETAESLGFTISTVRRLFGEWQKREKTLMGVA